MLTRSMLIAVVLTLASLALAQQNSQQQAAAAAPATDATTTCAATFASGSGENATQYCVTENGNIAQFSRGTDEYIRVGVISEGYAFCDITGGVEYFDYANADSGNWGPATFSSTATKATSTRVTSDGIWQIKNTITQVAANASGPGSAKIATQIKNFSVANRNMAFYRFADVDAASATTNDFDFTNDTVYGLKPQPGSGLGVTNNTFSGIIAHIARALNTFKGPNPCDNLGVVPQPFVGDGSTLHRYFLVVPKLGTKTITLTYKPI